MQDIRKRLKLAIKTTIDEWAPSCVIIDACVAEHTAGKREIRGVCWTHPCQAHTAFPQDTSHPPFTLLTNVTNTLRREAFFNQVPARVCFWCASERCEGEMGVSVRMHHGPGVGVPSRCCRFPLYGGMLCRTGIDEDA